MVKDYYKILQVSPDAEREVIDAAFRRLARKYHPDVYTEPDGGERMRELNEAYDVLGDAGKRAEYDRARREGARETRGGRTASGPEPGQKAGPPQRVEATVAGRRRLSPAMIGLMVFGVLLAVTAPAVAIVVGLSRGGGDDEAALQSTLVPSAGATGTPAATPTEIPTALQEQLRSMVLHVSDMPAGFSQVQESFSTNEEVAGEGGDAAETLAQLTQWGRIMGHGVVFSSESTDQGGVLLVDATVSLYQSDSGASSSFADAVNTARTTDWAATAGEATNVTVEEIPPLDVADEMLWLRLNGTATIGDPPAEQPFIQDVVILRVGRVRGSVSVVSSAADVAPAVEKMVRTQAANMAAGIE